jgi:hypothetical protein
LERPLTVDEIRAELSLRFERFTMKSARNEDGEVVEEHALLAAHKRNTTAGNYCTYCRKAGHIKPNCHKLKKKETR